MAPPFPVERTQKLPVSGGKGGYWTRTKFSYVAHVTKLRVGLKGWTGSPTVKVNATRRISRFVKKVTAVKAGKVTLTVTSSVTFGGES
jgi:hypothetical protein